MDYSKCDRGELVEALEDRYYSLMGWEHEIAKTLAGLGEEPIDLLRALLSEIRDYI